MVIGKTRFYKNVAVGAGSPNICATNKQSQKNRPIKHLRHKQS
ncbi:MAG: hypothetical protein ACRC62_16060 [Microcoleus sp.]